MSSSIPLGRNMPRSGAPQIFFPASEPIKQERRTVIMKSIITVILTMSAKLKGHLSNITGGTKPEGNGTCFTPKTPQPSSTSRQKGYKEQERYLRDKYGIPKMIEEDG